ncbi:hypothetical protein L3X38_034934 [Prunus dulcis]|uniref:Uncharacterized protein n=1 Tax=Prunus dulcis TaxID=3755 RepID=A0AAD4VIR3_PRUDU|nr:hypothetical protein L3X38_034934 [Prunus dulcis]
MLHIDDKLRGVPHNRLKGFKNWFDGNAMVDLGFYGPKFIWTLTKGSLKESIVLFVIYSGEDCLLRSTSSSYLEPSLIITQLRFACNPTSLHLQLTDL